ncbi:MAG: AbrB/MazE/SpoVT family DNA-binding domain-containing protein [Gemmatimonadota bacterium]|nr:MAG: AbrB/MazE/SpoVT family DNA-binding domain-containing protein [Gemmatimonadota bacterium]
MNTRIRKWGNSLGLRIPKSFAAEAGVAEGSEVDLTVKNGQLIVKPTRRRRVPLQDLLRRVRPDNLHEEIDTGGPVGREAW